MLLHPSALMAVCLVTATSGVPMRPDPNSDQITSYEPYPNQRDDRQITIPALTLDFNDLFRRFQPIFDDISASSSASASSAGGVAVATAAGPVGRDCDVAKFQLADPDFDAVGACQRQSGQDDQLRSCIVQALSGDGQEAREFLDRDDYSLAGISSSTASAMSNGVLERKNSVSFRLCPRDEINAIESFEESAAPPRQQQQQPSVVDTGLSAVQTQQGPGIHFPVVHIPEIQLPDLSDLFTSLFPSTGTGQAGSIFPGFPSQGPLFPPGFPNIDIPNINVPTVPSVDMENCVSERFDLSIKAFNMVRDCRYAEDFVECVKTELEGVPGAENLTRFVTKIDHEVVSTSFYTSVSSVNGRVSHNRTVRLMRCRSLQPQEGTAEEVEPAEVLTDLQPSNEQPQQTPLEDALEPERYQEP